MSPSAERLVAAAARARQRGLRLSAALAVALAAACMAAGAAGAVATTTATTATTTTAATPTAATTRATTTQVATTVTPSGPPLLQTQPGALTARIIVWTSVRNAPGAHGPVMTRIGPLTSWSRAPQTLLVVGTAQRDGQVWLRVLLGVRPDGSNGWIPRRLVQLISDPWWITIDKTTRTLTVSRNGVAMLSAEAVIGAAGTPTPDGIAAIWESDPQPSANDFLGVWALPLTVFSNVLTNFGGGPGRVAIHGRGGASLEDPLGSAASHGCIRIDNSAILWIAQHVPVGTPVDITGA